MSKDNEISLEEMFEQIESIIEELEDPSIAIEDAFAKYENGMMLLKGCNDKIDMIEKKVLAISDGGELNEFRADS